MQLNLKRCTFRFYKFSKHRMNKLIYIFISVFIISSCSKKRVINDKKHDEISVQDIVSKKHLAPDTIKIISNEIEQKTINKTDWILLNKDEIEQSAFKEIDFNVSTNALNFNTVPIAFKQQNTKLSYYITSNNVEDIKPQELLPMRKLNSSLLNVHCINDELRLPSGNVNFTYEDLSGNIWMSIDVVGLIKYNGHSIWRYSVNEGLCSNFIYSCIEDKNGNMFIATRHGLNIFNGKEIQLITINGKNKAVTSTTKKKNGDILFGLATGEIIRYDGFNFVLEYNLKNYIDDFAVNIIEDTKENVWINTSENGILKINNNELYSISSSLESSKVKTTAIFTDKNDQLWLGREDGTIVCIAEKKIIKYNIPSFQSGQISSIIQDSYGNLIFSSYGKGLLNFCNNKFYIINTNDDILSNQVNHILKGSTNNIWFSTITGGVMKYTENNIKNTFIVHASKGQFVYSTTESKYDKVLWYGINNYGIVKYDGFNYYSLNNNLLPNSYIYTIYCDKKNRLWIGLYGGVIKIENNIATYYTAKDQLYLNEPLTIQEDHSGYIWIGTYKGGIYKYNNHNFIYYGEEQGLSSYSVSSIIETKDSTIWVGFYDGQITKIKEKKIETLKLFETKSHKQITSMCEVSNGLVFVGTDHDGLFQIKDNKLLKYTTDEGLSSNSILSILWNNEKKSLFVATNNGLNICQFDSVKNNTSRNNFYVSTVLSKEDGFASNDFVERSAFISTNRIGIWSNGKGLTSFNLNEIFKEKKSPKLKLVGLDINGEYINYFNNIKTPNGFRRISFNEIDSLNNVPKDITLPYDLNHLTFRFNAIDWKAPNKIKYQYMISGIDGGWSKPSIENYVDYRNIPSGNYIFKVRTIGNLKKWTTPIEFHFSILPPFWQTWWFRILVITTIFITVFLLFKWRINVLKKRQYQFSSKLIKTQEDERTRISRELHDSVGQSLLSLNIKSNGEYYSDIVPIIEEVRSLSRNLAPINIDKIPLSKLIGNLIDSMSQNTSIFFSYDICENFISDLNKKMNLYRIIQEAISNILKHSNANNARITLEFVNNNFVLMINDDGVGFNVRLNESKQTIGLTSLKERAKFIDGVINIHSNANGTKIEIKFI